MEHRARVSERAARRQAAVKTAHDESLKKAVAEQQEYGRKINSGEIASEWATGAFPINPTPDPQAYAAARQAVTEAGNEFDAAEPETDFWTWRDRNASEPNMKAAR